MSQADYESTNSQIERLWYFTQAHAHFPSTFANNVQAMKACSAFAQAGQPTTLVIPRRLDTPRRLRAVQGSLWDTYAVPRNFEIDWCWFPYPFYRLQQSLYAPLTSVYALFRRVRVAYTRSDWIAAFLCRLGIPTALELHDYIPSPALRLALREARVGQLVGLVCISQALADKMRGFGFPEEAIFVAHDGVDLERFEPRLDKLAARTELGLPPEMPVVCHVGHLYAGRGVETLLACAARLPNVQFVIVGGNPEDIAKYQAQASCQEITNLQFVGQVLNSRIPTYLYAADVLAMPYTSGTPTHRYMSPMKMFEYLAAGRPIVAPDFPVLREVLMDRKNALLVEPANEEAFVAAVRRILVEETLAARLSLQAIQTARQYTWSERQRNILAFMAKRLTDLGFRLDLSTAVKRYD